MGFISPTLMKGIVKNILIIVFVLALMAGSIYEYFRLKKTDVPVSTAITAIPLDASFILECRRAYPLWKSVSQTSLLWHDLLGTESAAEFNHNVQFIDSLLGENPAVHSALEGNPLFISAHKNGIERFDYLFICSVPDASAQAAILPFMASQGSTSVTEYEGTSMYTLKHAGNDDLFYAISTSGIFICSFQQALVKESLRQLESHISLMNNRYFTKVMAASSDQVIANLFINFQAVNNTLSPFMNSNMHTTLSSLSDFAQWMELDLSFTPNEVVMNGFTDCDTTGSQFLELFTKQLAHTIKIGSVVPSNTALMSCMEVSDYPLYYKQYAKYMDLHRKLYKHNEWEEEIKRTYGFNPEKFFTWVDNEMGLVITEPTDSTLHNDIYAVIGANNVKSARATLDSLSDSVASVDNVNTESTKFMQHEIRSIGIDNILPNVLGGTFELLKKAYYTTVGNYVVFANTGKALQMFINHYEGGNTLDKDSYYQSFVKDHVEDESGIYVYNNIALSPTMYGQYLEKNYAAAVKKHADICRKFQAISMQMSYMQGMFYTNIYIKRNPQFKKQAGALWQVALDTTVATTPCWVTDFKTKNKYVFVQDKANYAYLISNTGEIQWKHKVDGRIISDINEVDVLKNGKTQYLFNTEKCIYILDRNGNNVGGFPVKLASPATEPITTFDYDGDKKYRILIPCEDKIIREYDVDAKQVEGWAKPETDDIVSCTIKHAIIEGKDYDVVIDNSGKVYTYDRKGETRIKLQPMPPNITDFYLQVGTSLSNSFILATDSTGAVIKLSFTDILTKTNYLARTNNHADFVPADLDGNTQTEMVFLTAGEVYTYSNNKALLFHCTGKDSLANLHTYPFPDNKVRIGAVDNKNNRLYLWDNLGSLYNSFPLYGSLGFNIADMNNDGQLYLVAGSQDANVYVYSIQ